MKKVTATLLAGIIFFILLTILSKDAYPGSSLYNFKRVYEKGVLFSKSEPPQKAEYLTQLLDIRLVELQHVYTVNRFFILSSSLRYSATAGEATQYIISNNLTDKVLPLKMKFEAHKKVIGKMAKEYKDYKGKGDNASFFQDAVNYADIYQNSLDDFCRVNKCNSKS